MKSGRIRLQRDICGDFYQAKQREWLETNGIGGFACSTVIGMNTRRYHSLLTAALHPPAGRFVLLSKLEESFLVKGLRYDLSTNQYSGAVHPRGFEFLHEFRLDPFPVFVYKMGELTLEKSLFMVHDENTTVVEYRLTGCEDLSNIGNCFLEVRPLLAFRDHHSLTRQNNNLNSHVELGDQVATVQPYIGLPPLHFAHNAVEIDLDGYWYFNFEYELERERGLDFVEDLFSPFLLRFAMTRDATATVIVTLTRHRVSDAIALREIETARREQVRQAAPRAHPIIETLTMAADQFIVKRGTQKAILAGYPWFTDWGRDTMIALPGLTLVTGWHDTARSILRQFAEHVDQGMVPNRFPDVGETPDYNTVDATLWFFEAVRAFLAHTGDYAFVREFLYDKLVQIIEWHERGTRYGISVDCDGLIKAGDENTQLTWMDAKVGDRPVTPRHGKPVEVQALWFNALRVLENLAANFGDIVQQKHCQRLATRVEQSFNEKFWNPAIGCLHDVVTDSGVDSSVRPNQILAVSLPYSMLPAERARHVVETVERELLTPFGLRSLSPRDERYQGRYAGDPSLRDAAYHQGTVWTWLIGPFVTAFFKVNGRTEATRRQVSLWLQKLCAHLHEAGLGQVSEIFDGDPPHKPRGCFAQAWSVAELLRVLSEEQLDLLQWQTAS